MTKPTAAVYAVPHADRQDPAWPVAAGLAAYAILLVGFAFSAAVVCAIAL